MPICLSKNKNILEVFEQVVSIKKEFHISKFNNYVTEYFYDENVLNQYVYETFHSYHENDFSAYLIHLIDYDKNVFEILEGEENIEEYYLIITNDNNGFVNGDFITLENGLKIFEIYQKQYEKYEEEALEEERIKSFIPRGVYGISNNTAWLIEISNCGSSARIKFNDSEVTDWLEIEYIQSCDCIDSQLCDCDSIPVIDPENYNISLSDVMKI